MATFISKMYLTYSQDYYMLCQVLCCLLGFGKGIAKVQEGTEMDYWGTRSLLEDLLSQGQTDREATVRQDLEEKET